MTRRLVLWLFSFLCLPSLGAAGFDGWSTTRVPGSWEGSLGTEGQGYDGFAWYRCYVTVPESWEGSRLLLIADEVGTVDQAYFNGERIGANGGLPPLFSRPASAVRRPFVIDPDLIRFGEPNLIAWRVFDDGGEGGILAGPVHLTRKDDAIDLAGRWLIRSGDKPEWADWLADDGTPEVAEYRRLTGSERAGARGIIPADKAGREEMVAAVRKRFAGNTNVHSNVEGKGQPKAPEAARAALDLRADLAVDTVLHEPIVRQPLYVDFDERGRLWVVQYIQYPDPAGLEVLTWDNHLRKVFDQVPPPPPYRKPEHQKFVGRDRITFHEDTNGDGEYDTHGVFVDGLNLATSIAFGRGGVWVMNPPYLLFYPDRNRDDIPDGDPEVHLSGFGLEDTHSIANSLKWGPDGWLYGAVGSTVTARVKAEMSGSDERHTFFGQNIWRYHPETYQFELFAEGGWNTFGVDFDDQGRLYSGTNGNLQAVYFVQGGYYQKSFGKHGPHTNPYTFGHFFGLPIEGERVRLVHQWILYNSGQIPGLEGHFVGGNALANKLHALRIETDGSTFRTVEVENPITTDDKWFRPVHAAVGPDGAIYVSDWYDARITHVDPRDNWDRDRGRIYRLRAKSARPTGTRNFSQLDSSELLALLSDRNQWVRRTAHRLLADRQDQTVVPALEAGLVGEDRQVALESLWALHELGGFNDSVALQGLSHEDPYVRMWSMRFVGDPKKTLSPAVFKQVLQLGRMEEHPEVLSQTAATAQRLSSEQGIPLVRVLAGREDVVEDPYLPQQIWWAMEAQIKQDPVAVVALLRDPSLWGEAVFRSTLAERLGRRFMAERSLTNLEICARLLDAAPSAEAAQWLIKGMEKALEGSEVDVLPEALEVSLNRLWENFPLSADLIGFAVRLGSVEGRQVARGFVADRRQELEERIGLLGNLSQLKDVESLPLFLELVKDDTSADALRLASLTALRRYGDQVIADVLVRELTRLKGDLATTAQSVLAGRSSWSLALLEAVDRGDLPRETVSYNSLLAMQRREDPLTATLIRKHWGSLRQPEETKLRKIEEVRTWLQQGRGNSERGRELFATRCGICHRLFDVGKFIGPELTGYERDNLEFLLPAIVDPSLALREEYELVSVTLRRAGNERETSVVTGFISSVDANSITVTDLVGNKSVIAKRDIAGQERSRLSAMPEGLLDELSEEEVRDLFAFIQK
jgi:putative heme-binding domain-containing protein